MATEQRNAEPGSGRQIHPRASSRPSYSRKKAGNIFERWQALLVADRAGDKSAYGIFLAELMDWLLPYFRRRIHDGGAEDALQETLIAVLRQRHTYSTDDPLGPWLMTIAHRKWVDSVRRRTRSAWVALDETYSIQDHRDAVTSAVLVEDCLATLKRPQRDAIVYRMIDGYSVSDTADMTGQSESLVKVNVHRGLRKLAATLAFTG